MKRTMKKLTALIMALAMVMSLVVVAQAADGKPTVTATIPATLPGVASTDVTFDYAAGIEQEAKEAFLAALGAGGKTVSITITGDWATAAASGSLGDGYSVVEEGDVDTEVTISIKSGDDAFGSIVIDFSNAESIQDPAQEATIVVKLAGAAPLGDDVTTEADADNSPDGITGTGSYEGYVDKEVFRVTLPTVEPADLAFTIDPLGLISATSAAAKENKTFASGSVFFLNTNNKTDGKDYSPNSDHFTVVNKGAVNVDVELTLSASGTAITSEDSTLGFVASESDFEGSTDTTLYMALNTKTTDADQATVTPIEKGATATAATASATIGTTEDAYEYTYDSETHKYVYSLKDDVTEFEELEFWLTGAANTNATDDWGLNDYTLAVVLTWKITKSEGTGGASSGPSVTATPGTLTNGGTISLSVSNATGYTVKEAYYMTGETKTALTPTGTIGEDGTATITLPVNRALANATAVTTVHLVLQKDDADDVDKEVTVRA